MMKSIHVVYYPGLPPVTLGVNDKKYRIIEVFGKEAIKIYGLE